MPASRPSTTGIPETQAPPILHASRRQRCSSDQYRRILDSLRYSFCQTEGAIGHVGGQMHCYRRSRQRSYGCTSHFSRAPAGLVRFVKQAPLLASQRRLRRHSSPCLIVSTWIGQTSMPTSGAQPPKPFTGGRGGPCMRFCVRHAIWGRRAGACPVGDGLLRF
jgi:hypothetical protein